MPYCQKLKFKREAAGFPFLYIHLKVFQPNKLFSVKTFYGVKESIN